MANTRRHILARILPGSSVLQVQVGFTLSFQRHCIDVSCLRISFRRIARHGSLLEPFPAGLPSRVARTRLEWRRREPSNLCTLSAPSQRQCLVPVQFQMPVPPGAYDKVLYRLTPLPRPSSSSLSLVVPTATWPALPSASRGPPMHAIASASSHGPPSSWPETHL